MKKIYSVSFLLFFIFSFLFSFNVNAQNNNLAAGDIAIVSYQADPDPGQPSGFDRFSIVVLRAGGIPASTVIYFTDNGWSVVSNTWIGSNEGYLQWTVPAGGVAQGTEVFFSTNAVDAWSVSAGTVTLVSANLMVFSTAGDQVIAYQTGPTGGPAGTYLDATRRFITGIHCNIVASVTTNAGWDVGALTTSGGNQSAMPPGLTGGAGSGNTAFVMTKTALPFAGPVTGTEEPDNGKYNCTGSTGSVPATIRDAIYLFGTGANWDLSDATAFPVGQSSNNCTYFSTPAPVINTHPSAATACAGLPVSFTVSATGLGLTYQWQEDDNVGFSSPTVLSNTGIYSNTGTATLNISDNTTINGLYYRAVVSNSGGSTNSNGALNTSTANILPTGNTSVTQSVGTANNLYFASACRLIAKVVPSGGTPVSGNVTSETWREGSVLTYGGQPYVQRHYQVAPSAGSTGTVTLYFSQADFDNFNAHPGSVLNLPTGPGDATGIANLRISKFNGSSNDGSGLPGTYTSGGQVINPVDGSIVWNASASRWEVAFDVSGFSGFFVQTFPFVLPVNLISFSAQKSAGDIQLKWQTDGEANNDHFELQRSTDGRAFIPVTQITGSNGTDIKNYAWNDAGAGSLNYSKLFYRLKIVSMAGSADYSNTIVVYLAKKAGLVTGIMPNPFTDQLNVGLSMPKTGQVILKLTDMSGAVLRKEYVQAPKGFSTHGITGMEKFSAGIYFVSVEFEGEVSVVKVVK